MDELFVTVPTFKSYGSSARLEQYWKLNSEAGQKVAAIITYAGSIEYYLERAIWRCKGIEPRGTKPETDAKSVTQLLKQFEAFSQTLNDDNNQRFVETWCEACSSAFIIRNNIAHGVASIIGDTLTYSRNPCWEGEIRKRAFGDFWADSDTLNMVCDSFAVLLRIISQIENGIEIKELTLHNIAVRALKQANSILGEFSCRDYNPSFEKY